MKADSKFTKRILSFIMSLFMIPVFANFPMDTAGGDEPDFKSMANELMVLVNNAREDAGLKPLLAVPYMNDKSYERAREVIFDFSHERGNGLTFADILDENMIPWSVAYENLASGMGTAEATFLQWKNSPDHWSAIMNPNVKYMSAAVTYDPDSKYKWYWEQMFLDIWNDVDVETEAPCLRDAYDPRWTYAVPVSNGDINGDKEVDSFDYILLLQYLNGEVKLNPEQIQSAEIFKDGAISYLDAAYLKMYVLGEVPTLEIDMSYIVNNRR